MAMNTKLSSLLIFLTLLFVSVSFASAIDESLERYDDGVILLNTERRDPQREYQQCRQQCQQQGEQQQQCQQRCEDQYQQQRQDPQREYQQCQQQCSKQPGRHQQQCRRQCQEQYGRQQPNPQCQEQCRQQPGQEQEQCQRRCEMQQQDPQREYQQCQEQCRQQPGQQQRRCQQSCEERLQEQQGEKGYEERETQGEQRGMEENENPYLFRRQRLTGRITSQEGNFRVLERFARRSNLLEGIDNYRVALLDMNPNTFFTPHHWDADTICVVLNGRGSITFVQQNNKETHNIERGDIFRIPAGTTVHTVNRDNNERLYVADITVPVNTPGQFKSYFASGGSDQESFFNAFSDQVLEAAFNTESGRLRRMFQGQNRGPFVRASQEQIQALSRESSEHGVWPFGRGGQSESRRPYNLLNQRPIQSNRYGQLYQATPDDYQQLQDLDITVSFANITRGAMIGPYYNSRSTKIAMVVGGDGYFEMPCACPTLSQQQGGESSQRGYQESGSKSYQRFTARVSHGDVFVVPAGHPIVAVASGNQNLQVVCFETNARDNQKHQLAGNNNIMKQLESVAKELSFNIPAREVEEILNRQQESMFFPGPQQRQQAGGQSG